MELRDYQLKAKKEIYHKWQQGAKNVLVQLSTGAGKTVLFSNILAEEPGASIAIAHRAELVSQISLTLARHGVRHNIIAQPGTIRNIVALHMQQLKQSFYNPHARCNVAGVHTLIKMQKPWFSQIKLVVQDEAHHVLAENTWGRAALLFPNARGLYPTATPIRADGKGLGRHADGLMDAMVQGPTMRELINLGYLTDYRPACPTSKKLDLSAVPLSASGDFSPPKLRNAVQKAQITGDVVAHYLKFASGKLGVTFAVSVEAATEIAAAFREAGVPAEVISAKTPDLLRYQIMDKFRNREILQLVNVDLLGEGVDVPAIEVVSMARPTQSYAVYVQQFGRSLRPMQGKDKAIILDHVGNIARHGLPDILTRQWSLDRRCSKKRLEDEDVIPLRICVNPECMAAYERVIAKCPYCAIKPEVSARSSPEFVDGDLTELAPEVLAALRGEITRIDSPPQPPGHLDKIAQRAVTNNHYARQRAQVTLRNSIALWAGYQKDHKGYEDSEIYKRFYFKFGTDILTAQTFNAADAGLLAERIEKELNNLGVIEQ